MIQGHEPGSRWRLQETRVTTIGRSSRNQISLVNPSVSRFHCEISYINGLWYVADLNSKKGTFLNGRQVTEREVLKPGDIVRVSKNVFKFDLVDETAKQDEGLLAIREASMGTEIQEKDAHRDHLDEMRQRQQFELEAKQESEEEVEEPAFGAILRQISFVLFVGLVVALLTAGTLAYGKSQAQRKRESQEAVAESAARALRDALELANGRIENYPRALEALEEVREKYEGFPEAERAARRHLRCQGEWFENGMEKIEKYEKEGRFDEALAYEEKLLKGLERKRLLSFVDRRQDFTLRMAGTVYRRMDQTAQELLDNGETSEAREIYREAADRIGVPSLVREARQKMSKIPETTGDQREGEGNADTGEESTEESETEDEAESGADEDEAESEDERTPSEEELNERLKPPKVW